MVQSFTLSAYWLTSPQLSALFETLGAVGEARVVGGAVRNTLLGEPVGDIDIATDAVPEAVTRAARQAGMGVHETGLAHGTVTVVVDGTPFEVTTLREDVSTDGRRATVRFTRDFAVDAGRRDFTMNALYVDRQGHGVDHVGGYQDCLDRRVRFIGDPDTRILEDHLRILRLFRFHAHYGEGPIDAEGLAAARRHRALIGSLSAERVHAEVMKLLTGRHAAEVLEIVAGENFLDPFVPHRLNVGAYRALRDVEEAAGRPVSALLGLVALLDFDAESFGDAAAALRFSRKARTRGLVAIETARLMPPRSVPHVRSLLYEHGVEAFSDGLILSVAQGVDVIDVQHLLAEARRWSRPRFPVGGDDLLQAGGESGPDLGERLKRLETLWRSSDFSLDREALLALDRDHATRRR